jgi:hypothetical protein
MDLSHLRSRRISPEFSCISHSGFPYISNGSPCISHPGFSCLTVCVSSMDLPLYFSSCIFPGFSCISHSEFPCFSNVYACISHPGFSSIFHVSRLDYRVFSMDISFSISMYFPPDLYVTPFRSCIFLFLPWICIHTSRIFLNLPVYLSWISNSWHK